MHETQSNGVFIVRTPTGIGVALTRLFERPVCIEVNYGGKLYRREYLNSNAARWRDYYHGLDMLQCAIRVKDGELLLAELPVENEPMPFMVLQGEQHHITESYVSVPPALTITDERGDVWTLGFATAQKEHSPCGEFAFNVLRNGIDTHEIASRIERRAGKVRIFTRRGWKIWNGNTFT